MRFVKPPRNQSRGPDSLADMNKLSRRNKLRRRGPTPDPDASVRAEPAYFPAATRKHVMPTRILVTGGAGFIRSYLVHRLVSEGYQAVTVLDNLSRGRTANLPEAWESARFIKADMTDRNI